MRDRGDGVGRRRLPRVAAAVAGVVVLAGAALAAGGRLGGGSGSPPDAPAPATACPGADPSGDAGVEAAIALSLALRDAWLAGDPGAVEPCLAPALTLPEPAIGAGDPPAVGARTTGALATGALTTGARRPEIDPATGDPVRRVSIPWWGGTWYEVTVSVGGAPRITGVQAFVPPITYAGARAALERYLEAVSRGDYAAAASLLTRGDPGAGDRDDLARLGLPPDGRSAGPVARALPVYCRDGCPEHTAAAVTGLDRNRGFLAVAEFGEPRGHPLGRGFIVWATADGEPYIRGLPPAGDGVLRT